MENLVSFASNSPRVLDVDDSIWIGNFHALSSAKRLAKNVDLIFAGNNFIADWYSRHCNSVYVIPTAIDCSRIKPAISKHKSSENRKISIGWTGTSGNLKYLKIVEKPLSKFLERHHDASVTIISDRKPSFSLIPEAKVNYIQWTQRNEVKDLHEIDIGIMPLIEDEWTLGKCSYKMLQYMALGIPVVVSPVGMNKELLSKGEIGYGAKGENEWYDAFEILHSNQTMRYKMGSNGRLIASAEYDTGIIAQKIARIFTRIAS